MNLRILSILTLSSAFPLMGQNKDSLMFHKIFDEALLRGQSYQRLGELCKTVGSRLSGSDNAEKGIVWATNMLRSYAFDTVFQQPVMVPRWERSITEELWLESGYFSKELEKDVVPNYDCEAFEETHLRPSEKYKLMACALGGSVGTTAPIKGKIVVVYSDKELQELGTAGKLKDKIVLYNRAFDESLINTFAAYGSCVSQRFYGASKAAVYGATAVLVRSMTNRCDLHPHTGSMGYEDSMKKIPAMAVASAVANLLERLSKADAEMTVTLNMDCRTLPDRESSNVIAETKGSKFPQKYIAFGGHFDSWDEGEGAHDDGAGCMHAFEALRILKAIGYEPRHNLRCVFWINEENGLRGATEYARLAKEKNETHVAALESDRGGYTPRGYYVDSALLAPLKAYQNLLNKYGIGTLEKGGGGADIGPLRKVDANTLLIGFMPDSQRYFDVHHAETDVFESVNKRELEMGAASVAVMIYILDQILD